MSAILEQPGTSVLDVPCRQSDPLERRVPLPETDGLTGTFRIKERSTTFTLPD